MVYPGCRIGARCILHSGAVIGADGFGIARDEGRWVKIPQIGAVRIGDDVEIGANTTIDRGALDDTVIDDGVKLDNQIQIGHNARIGAHTAIAGCVGIAGSADIGSHCMIGGAAMILGHLTIGDDVHVVGRHRDLALDPQAGHLHRGLPVRRQHGLGAQRRASAPSRRAGRPRARAGEAEAAEGERRKTMAEMDIHEVLEYLPHRYPFLMIDRVLECEPGKRIVALKNVSANEPLFPGPFPAAGRSCRGC